MDQKNQSPWDRDVVKERALAAQPLDAVFIVTQYNIEHRGYPKQDILDLNEVLINIPPNNMDEFGQKVRAILSDESYFGEKHWTGTRSHQEIIDEMIRRHPGLSLETYNEVLHTGIRHTR